MGGPEAEPVGATGVSVASVRAGAQKGRNDPEQAARVTRAERVRASSVWRAAGQVQPEYHCMGWTGGRAERADG